LTALTAKQGRGSLQKGTLRAGAGKTGSEGGATKGQMGQVQFCNTCRAIAGHREKDIAMKKLLHVDKVKFEFRGYPAKLLSKY
jgi:hypothetical protein